MQCESNDRLGTIHTSDYRSRSFTGEENEEEEYDKHLRFGYGRFLMWRDEGMCGHSYG